MNGSTINESTKLTNGHAIVTDLVENILEQANEQIIINNGEKKIDTNNQNITSNDNKMNDEYTNHQSTTAQQHHHNKKNKDKDIDRSVKVK